MYENDRRKEEEEERKEKDETILFTYFKKKNVLFKVGGQAKDGEHQDNFLPCIILVRSTSSDHCYCL